MYLSQSQTLRQRYKIIELIGSGSFGNTYLAIDLDFPIQRRCVVKHLAPKNLQPQAIGIAKRLFAQEAETLSRLGEHDYIPRLYAYFESDDQFFLVQELIEGHDLRAEFEPGKKWSEAKVLGLLQEILAILAVVHRAGMIHRDLKPANIMRRQQDGQLVLIDFGAVKRVVYVDASQKKDSTVAIGTIAYMAPEQTVGKPDKYSDIYALGKLAIQALTGLASADLPSDSEQFEQLLIQQQISISPWLRSVLSKMISFQPQNRYADADEALQALNHYETEIDPKPKLQSANQLIIGFLCAIALLLGGGFFWRYFTSVNYAQLETYLQNKQWQQADQESDHLLLKVAGDKSALDSESINQFPCKSLQKIDQLWMSHSQGRFGYTHQKKAYLATGNEFNNYTQSSTQNPSPTC